MEENTRHGPQKPASSKRSKRVRLKALPGLACGGTSKNGVTFCLWAQFAWVWGPCFSFVTYMHEFVRSLRTRFVPLAAFCEFRRKNLNPTLPQLVLMACQQILQTPLETLLKHDTCKGVTAGKLAAQIKSNMYINAHGQIPWTSYLVLKRQFLHDY